MSDHEDYVDESAKGKLRGKLQANRKGASKYDAIPKAIAKDPVGSTELLLAGFGVPEVRTAASTARGVVATAEKAGGIASRLARFGDPKDPTTQAVQAATVGKEGINQADKAGERKAMQNSKKKLPGAAAGGTLSQIVGRGGGTLGVMAATGGGGGNGGVLSAAAPKMSGFNAGAGTIANNPGGSGGLISAGLRNSLNDQQKVAGMKAGGFITMKGPRRGSKGMRGKKMPKNGVMMAKAGAVVGGTKKTGTYKGKSNKLGYGGRAAQLRDKGVPEAVIGQIARRKGAAPGGPNYHGGK